jgi:hypothetical protein
VATQTLEPDLSRAQLIQVVRTGREVKGVGKMRALATLQLRGRRDVSELFLEVAAADDEPPRFRQLAALGLYRMGGPRAQEALEAAAGRADAATAPTIATGLGRIGPPESMDTIDQLERKAPAHARDRVAFAATLLAYRFNLDGHDVRAPAGNALQQLGRKKARPIEVTVARQDVAARALESLADDPLGIELLPKAALRISCEPNTFVWVWAARAEGGDPAVLMREKGVAGVLFRRRLFENAYALSAIGLVTPMRGGARLTVHRAASGLIEFAGTFDADGSGELRARDHPGLPAVEVQGRLTAGRLEITKAMSAILAPKANEPKPA